MSEDKPFHPAVEGPESGLEETRHPEASVVAEPPHPAAEAVVDPAEGAEVAALRDELARAQEETARIRGQAADVLDKYQRLAADFENFRRRARDENAASQLRGRDAFLSSLLPVLDNLELALSHTQDEGLKLLARQLRDTLASQGISILNPENEAFDAKFHEAIGQEAREGVKSGTVLTVAQKGYAAEGRVLRPARVIVAA